MTLAKTDLCALIGSRICHDLISPLGAIGNGVELLAMSGLADTPEVALITESVANANARIRYFRVAFGAAAAEQRMARAEITSILADTMRGGRLQVDWTVTGDLPRREVRLAFLLIQCLETAMPFGGQITATRDEFMDGGRWQITGRATKLKVDPGLWEVLSNPAAPVEISPAQVHFALVPEELHRQNRRLTLEVAEAGISMRF